MSDNLYWEYTLYNLEITEPIEYEDFTITQIDNYDEIKEYLGQVQNQHKSAKVFLKNRMPSTHADSVLNTILTLLSFAQSRAIVSSEITGYNSIEKKSVKTNRIKYTIFGKPYGDKIILDHELSEYMCTYYKLEGFKRSFKENIFQALFYYNITNFTHAFHQSDFIFPWIALEILIDYFVKHNKDKVRKPEYSFDVNELLKVNKRFFQEQKVDKEEIDKVLNIITFNLKNLSLKEKIIDFLHYIEFPRIDERLKKFNEIYNTRCQIFHTGFYSKGQESFQRQVLLLRGLMERVFLLLLEYKNSYVYGDFWYNPFVRCEGKIEEN